MLAPVLAHHVQVGSPESHLALRGFKLIMSAKLDAQLYRIQLFLNSCHLLETTLPQEYNNINICVSEDQLVVAC